MFHWLAVLLLAVHIFFPTAQKTVEITDLGATPAFGKEITFRVRVVPVSSVRELLVFITPESRPTVWQQIDLSKAGADGEIMQQVDVRQLSLYPFSKVSYRYEATLADGQKVQGAAGAFQYDDDRFQWQTLDSGIFQIHWYGGDSTLGPLIANAAQEGLQTSQAILRVTPPSPLRIYTYTNSNDLQTALQMTNQPWIAGHATPELNMILITVPSGPEKKLEIERKIPHEIMHILQYQVMGSNYTTQPVWLVEGMASLAENFPNPDYRSVLQKSSRSNSLIPIRSLCSAFPKDAGGAFLAYAQSDSFVRFLHTKYGASGIRELVDQYQNGLGCEEGFSAALGVPMSLVETRWQQEELGLNVFGLVISNLAPYLLIGLLLALSAGLAFFSVRPKNKTAEKSI